MTNDKQRERLVELLDEFVAKSNNTTTSALADHILADGWMRPPVKVGQSFWHIEEYTHELLPDEYPTVKVVCESKVENIFIEKYGNSFGDTRKSFIFHDIGKTVFLTKEKAEQALVTDTKMETTTEGGNAE